MNQPQKKPKSHNRLQRVGLARREHTQKTEKRTYIMSNKSIQKRIATIEDKIQVLDERITDLFLSLNQISSSSSLYLKTDSTIDKLNYKKEELETKLYDLQIEGGVA